MVVFGEVFVVSHLGKVVVVSGAFQEEQGKHSVKNLLVMVFVGVQEERGGGEDAADFLPMVVVPALNYHLHLRLHHQQGV